MIEKIYIIEECVDYNLNLVRYYIYFSNEEFIKFKNKNPLFKYKAVEFTKEEFKKSDFFNKTYNFKDTYNIINFLNS